MTLTETKCALSRLPPTVQIIALFLGLVTVVHAQTPTTRTVSAVAHTSSSGTVNTYAAGDTTTVGLTFSEAVAVTGKPYGAVD